MARKHTYGSGVDTTTMRVPKGREDFVRICLTLIPVDVDNPLEYLQNKIKETEDLLDLLKKQVK